MKLWLISGMKSWMKKGELDRAKLSDIVFADRVELSVLNGIVHPRVKEEIQKKITREERKNTNLMLIEGALLIEDHYEEICDELWYVYVEGFGQKENV